MTKAVRENKRLREDIKEAVKELDYACGYSGWDRLEQFEKYRKPTKEAKEVRGED